MNPVHTHARRSLASVLATGLFTTLHHYYRFGLRTLLLGAVVLGLPTALMLAYRSSRKLSVLIAYQVVSAWIIVGFGLIDGMWRSTFKVLLGHGLLTRYAQYLSWDPVGSFAFEATGVLASLASLLAAYYTVRFIAAALTAAPAARVTFWRWNLGLVVLAVAALGVSASARLRAAAAPGVGQTIKIGVIVPTRGPAALLGASFLKAVELAREDLGPTKHRYELVVADTGLNPVQTRRAIQKLIGVDRVSAIVGGISLPGEVVKPYATYAKIPHLCVCSVQRIGDGAFNFTNIPLPEDEAARWVEEAQTRGIRRVALLTQDYPSIDGHVAALKQALARAGIAITYTTRFRGATREFGPLIQAAKVSQPDVFFIEATEPALDRLGTQLRAAGVTQLSSIVAPSLSAQPSLFEGAWYTDSHLADPSFATRFERRFPGERFATHMMPYAYDSLRLLVEAFESGRDVSAYVRERTAYDGMAGHVTRAAGSGNYRSRPAVWTIQNGKLVQLTKAEG